MMKSPDDAKRIGGRTAAMVCLGVLIVFEAIVFFAGPHDDFATEGRAYMLTQLDPVLVTAAIVLFVTVFFLGRVAAQQIIAEGRSPVRVGVFSGIFTLGIVLLYIVGFSLLLRVEMVNWKQMVVVLVFLVGTIWLLTAWRLSARLRGSHP